MDMSETNKKSKARRVAQMMAAKKMKGNKVTKGDGTKDWTEGVAGKDGWRGLYDDQPKVVNRGGKIPATPTYDMPGGKPRKKK